jgi:hypothetical protein
MAVENSPSGSNVPKSLKSFESVETIRGHSNEDRWRTRCYAGRPYDRVVATRFRHPWNPSDLRGPLERLTRRDQSCDETTPPLHHA